MNDIHASQVSEKAVSLRSHSRTIAASNQFQKSKGKALSGMQGLESGERRGPGVSRGARAAVLKTYVSG